MSLFWAGGWKESLSIQNGIPKPNNNTIIKKLQTNFTDENRYKNSNDICANKIQESIYPILTKYNLSQKYICLNKNNEYNKPSK